MKLTYSLLFFFLTSPVVLAQSKSDLQNKVNSLEERLQRLETEMNNKDQSLVDEIAKMKTLMAVPELEQKTFGGLGIGASKVYFSKSPLSIGGYGEMVYKDYRGGTTADSSDMYRFVPYIGYRFSDNIILNVEIEFEHGGAYKGTGESIIEFAYLDFLHSEKINLRVGHLLVPIGYINLKHEPTYFYSVLRPETETKIIPSTWHENGGLLFGKLGPIDYQIGAVNGMKSTAAALKKDSWIREGRQRGAEAKHEDWGHFARLDFSHSEEFSLGGSYYWGDSDQDTAGLNHANIQLWETHLEAQFKGFWLQALYTQGQLSEAGLLSVAGDVIGSQVKGHYVTLAYDLKSLLNKMSGSLSVFARYEDYNTHDKVPAGFSADDSLHKVISTVGLSYKPVTNVVLKGNYQFRKNEEENEDDRFELGMGFVF